MEIEEAIKLNTKTTKSLGGWIFTCPVCNEQIESLYSAQCMQNAKMHILTKHEGKI